MLGYDSANPSSIMLSCEETEPNRPVFDPYTTQNYSHDQTANFNPETNFTAAAAAPDHHHHPFHHPINPITENHFTNFHDPPTYISPTPSYPHALEPAGPTGFMVLVKREQTADDHWSNAEFNSRIGLNLGGRTYFSSSENDLLNRVYLRSKILEPAGSVSYPKCQAEGCNADLSNAKNYHRRHKVCDFHSKAATVVAAGLTQRFCQQCSRFHLLSEFDNGKRSCRRRLADHNRRRRKSHQLNQENNKSQLESNAHNSSSGNLTRLSPDDSEPFSSSTTVAMSPPRISLDCFGHRSYTGGGGATSSTASTSSLFY